MKKNNAGFTLVELMIVVAIIGILSAISYPSYTDYLLKGRRVIAQGELLAFASAMEQYYVQNGSDYRAGGVDDAAPAVYSAAVTIEGVAMYALAATSVRVSSYSLRATPNAGTVQNGNGYVQITDQGVKTWNSPGGLTDW